MKSFIAYSIFRAFYGAGILVVTYFVDRETAVPWWLFLAFSMVFSRLLLRGIKARWPGMWGQPKGGEAA